MGIWLVSERFGKTTSEPRATDSWKMVFQERVLGNNDASGAYNILTIFLQGADQLDLKQE